MCADKSKSEAAKPGRYSYEGLERVLHEKARLGLMTSLLARPDGLFFSDLKELCDLSDGNLNRHLEVLTEAGFVQVRKDKQQEGRGRTQCQITKLGRTRFLEYLQELERVVADAAKAAEASGKEAAVRRLSTS